MNVNCEWCKHNDTVIAIIQTRTGPIKAFILSTK